MAGAGEPIPVFRARGLTKTYRMGEVEVPALRGIDLDLWPGEFVVLLGASGSGKSTLLNILGGLDTATSGSASWTHDGAVHELIGAGDAELTRYRREHVGFVFQFYNLIPSLTARENVALVTDLAEDPMKPEDALALVGLWSLSHVAGSATMAPDPVASWSPIASGVSRKALDSGISLPRYCAKAEAMVAAIAAASVKRDETNLGFATIAAPVAGVVLSRDVEVGDAVSSILVMGSQATLVMTLGDVLFDKLGYKGGRKGKSGQYSTDQAILEGLAGQGAVVATKVLEWRQLSKLKSTYTDALQAAQVAHVAVLQWVLSSASPSRSRCPSPWPTHCRPGSKASVRAVPELLRAMRERLPGE